MFARAWRFVTHPYTRVGLRAARTVGFAGGIYTLGYSTGVQASLEDPEGVQRSVLQQILRQHGSGGILEPEEPDSRFVRRLGVQLIHAAEGHVAQELEEVAGDEAARAQLETKLRALHSLPWKFVVIDDPSVNAFVAEMLPGYVFVHRGLLEQFERNEAQLSFILAHELSHYLLDHGSRSQQLHGV